MLGNWGSTLSRHYDQALKIILRKAWKSYEKHFPKEGDHTDYVNRYYISLWDTANCLINSCPDPYARKWLEGLSTPYEVLVCIDQLPQRLKVSENIRWIASWSDIEILAQYGKFKRSKTDVD